MNKLLVLILFISSSVTAEEFKDYMVQSPKTETPKRGTLKGEYSSIGAKALSLKTGSFNISLPIKFPHLRGNMQYPFTVNYSPSFGLGEFGIGWSSNLKISRVRDSGVINYLDDNLSTPWGKMVQGDSGFYYTENIVSRIKLEIFDKEIIVYLPDGTKVYYGSNIDDAYCDESIDGNIDRWMINYAQDAIGHKTKYQYQRFEENGESYLVKILYGGLADDYQYQVDFSYKTNSIAFIDQSLGKSLKHNRNIETIIVSALEVSSFVEIYKYKLTYKYYKNSPGSNLLSIQKFYTENDFEPKVMYEYDDPTRFLLSTQWIENSSLSALADKYHTRLTNYYFTSLNDFNNDGRLDLELGQEYGMYHNSDNGFQEVTLSEPQGEVSSWCLFPVPTARKSRSFLNPLGNNTETFVYDLFKYKDETILDVCKLNGERVDYFRFPRFWEKGPKTIFADINKDNKPDLIHLRGDAYEVIYNTSTDATVNFSDTIEMTAINLPTSYSSFWINDINGDGHQDMILKADFSLLVHFGMSNGKFRKDYESYRFYLPFYVPTSYKLKDRNLQFVDVNKDSLPDVLMQIGGIVTLYVNTGSSFIQQYIPGMFTGLNYSQNIISGDITGDGNRELLTTVIGTNQVFSLPLDRHGLGMMKSMDDGKGNQISFTYGKSNPVVGIPNRKTIITNMERTSVGEGTTQFLVNYSNPQLNSITKNFLGFKEVTTQRDSLGIDKKKYFYDTENRGLLESTESYDFLKPNFTKYSQLTYFEEIFDGRAVNFNTEVKGGYRNTTTNYTSELTTTNSYNVSTLCLESSGKSDQIKNITTNKTFEVIGSLTDHLTCFESNVNLIGNNFNYQLEIQRDPQTRVTQISRGGYLQQQMTYGLNGNVESIFNTGKGISSYSYDLNYRINQFLEPNGVQTNIDLYSIINDSPLNIKKTRPSYIFEQSFTYDGIGRLNTLWHNLGNYSQAIPFKTYSYEFANNDNLAATQEIENISYAANNQTSVERYFWESASGKEIATALVGENKTSIQGLKEYQPAQNQTKSFRTSTLPNTTNLMSLTPSDFDYSFLTQKTISDYIGNTDSTDTLVFNTSHNIKTFDQMISNNNVSEEIKENNDSELITSTTKDAFGHAIKFIQQEGNEYLYTHDSLGRVTNITFPNSEVQAITYHSTLGFVSSISRTSIGRIEYDYDLTTNLLLEKRVLGKGNLLDNKTTFIYDNIGRVTQRTHTNYDSSVTLLETATYNFLYDGNYYNKPLDTTQLGHLTAIQGDKYVKEFSYAEDEQIILYELYIDNKKKLSKATDYYSQRSLKSEIYTLTDLTTSNVLVTRQFDYEYHPTHGALDKIYHNNVPFNDFTFNELLETTGTTYSGNFLTIGRDTNTSRVDEISENGMSRVWSYNNRDLINTMSFDFGNRTMDKTYTYSPNTYLESISQIDSNAANLNMEFTYDIDGIITNVFKNGNNTNHERFSDSWKIGTKTYDLDHMGRVIFKRGKHYIFGATGRISKIRKFTPILATYYYDEENNPIVKIYKNGDLEFYHENSLIKENDFYQPITIPGLNQTVGYYKNNTFEKVDTDNLGSLIRNKNNFINVVTPYGERDNRVVDDHDILDFTLKGYDKDIDAVRMGRRYYDPQAKRFLAPDSYYLENSDKILKSPVQGNLYSYAANNPITMIDPTGDDVWHFSLGYFLGIPEKSGSSKGYVKSLDIGIGFDTNTKEIFAYKSVGKGDKVYGTPTVSGALSVGSFDGTKKDFYGTSNVKNATVGLVTGGTYETSKVTNTNEKVYHDNFSSENYTTIGKGQVSYEDHSVELPFANAGLTFGASTSERKVETSPLFE